MSEHQFDRARWQSRSTLDQLGNIGSEVGRAMNAVRRGDDEAMVGALYRGLDLIDASVETMPLLRKRELLRARELFAEAVIKCQPDEKLEAYFMQYAVAARS